MKIRGKINLLVGLMGLVACLIGGMGLFAVVQYRAMIDDYQQTADRAYKGERLNRLVTAVVMDARGIYAAKDVVGASSSATAC